MFGIKRFRAVSRIIEFARQVPDCAATRLRLLASSEPDILIIIRGRAILLKVIHHGEEVPQAAIDAADVYQQAGARIVFVRDNPARILDIIAQVAEEQDRVYAYDPRKDLR
jgi:2-methylisocitrate lyase-like PEP mutase family enzyme